MLLAIQYIQINFDEETGRLLLDIINIALIFPESKLTSLFFFQNYLVKCVCVITLLIDEWIVSQEQAPAHMLT